MDSVIDAVEEETDDEEHEPDASDDDLPDIDELNGGGDGGISDEELDELLEQRTTNITVIGCGGAGSNTATRMIKEGIDEADIIAANTDVQHLRNETQADTKLLLGKNLTGGQGAGSVPRIGEESAKESRQDIEDAVSGSDMVFITAGMGGGTGTGAAPVVADIAQDEGALTISVVTTPFEVEGERRHDNAEAGLAKLREVSDTVIVVPNERLLDEFGQMPVRKAFRVSDEVLMRACKGITELITTSGLVNLDFADVKTVMENGDVAVIGLGESDSNNRAEDSVKSALRSPLLDVDITGADSVLVNVAGGDDMSIEEAEGVVEHIHERVGDDTRIIWGTSINEELGDAMQTMLVVTGVDSPQIYGDIEEEVEEPDEDIDFIN